MDSTNLQPQHYKTRFDLAASTGDVWEVDLVSGTLLLSERFKQRLGYARHEIDDTLVSWANLLHPDDRETVRRAFFGHLKNANPYEVEYRSRAKSGDYRWFSSRG